MSNQQRGKWGQWGAIAAVLLLAGCPRSQPPQVSEPSEVEVSDTEPAIDTGDVEAITEPITEVVDSVPEPTTNAGTVYALGDAIAYENDLGKRAKLTFESVREFSGEGILQTPPDGKTWLAVTVNVENTGDEDFIVTFNQIELVDRQGENYRQNLRAESVLETDLTAVPSGETLQGDVAFEVPEEAEIDRLVYDPSNGLCAQEESELAASFPCDRLPIVVDLVGE